MPRYAIVTTTPDGARLVRIFGGAAEGRWLGGPGSGNFGHAGRPGEVGGSADGGASIAERKVNYAKRAEKIITKGGLATTKIADLSVATAALLRQNGGVAPEKAANPADLEVRAQGVVDALDSLKNSDDPAMRGLGKIVEDKMDGVVIGPTGNSGVSHSAIFDGANDAAYFGINTEHDFKDSIQQTFDQRATYQPNTFSGQVAVEAMAHGASLEEATALASRVAAHHEFGHLYDQATQGHGTSELNSHLIYQFSGHPDRDNAMREYMATYVSPYAGASLDEAWAELFSMVSSGYGNRVPKELHNVVKKLKDYGARYERKSVRQRERAAARVEWMTPEIREEIKRDPKLRAWVEAVPDDVIIVEKKKEPRSAGGPGSGNFGHSGRPGEVGGSGPSGGGGASVREGEPHYWIKGKKVTTSVPDLAGKSMADYETTTLTAEKEFCTAYGADGQQVFTPITSDDRGGVWIPKELAEKLPGSVFTHNHPNSGTFSDADIITASRWDMKEMRAAGRDGTYVMRPGEKGWMREPATLIYKYSSAVRQEFDSAISRGFINNAEANQMHWHEIWKRLEHDYPGNFQYRFETRDGKEMAPPLPHSWGERTEERAATRATEEDDDGFYLDDSAIIYPMYGPGSEKNPMRHAGGPGSGNFGHAGRPGEVGGSAPGGGGADVHEAQPKYERFPNRHPRVKEEWITESAKASRQIPFPPKVEKNLEAVVVREEAKTEDGYVMPGTEDGKFPDLLVKTTTEEQGDRLEAMVNRATPDQYERGLNWWRDQGAGTAIDIMEEHGERGDLSINQVAAVVAVNSSNTNWDNGYGTDDQLERSNQVFANTMTKAWADNPSLDLTQEDLVAARLLSEKHSFFRGAPLPTETGVVTLREMAKLDPRTALIFFGTGDKHSYGTLPTNALAAMRILRGDKIDDALSPNESKVRSMYRNIMSEITGEEDESSTNDVWMGRIMTGTPMDGHHYGAWIGNTGRYEYHNRIVTSKAHERGLITRQYQAIAWVVLQEDPAWKAKAQADYNAQMKKWGKEAKRIMRTYASKRRALAIAKGEDEPPPFEDGKDHAEEMQLMWFSRFRAHDKGVNVDDDPVFGPWDEEDEMAAMAWRQLIKEEMAKQPRSAGGPGSGNFGHAGRPGEVGGSSPGGGGGTSVREDEPGYEVKEPWKDPGGWAHSGVTWQQPTDPTTGRPIPIKVKTVEEAVALVLAHKVVEVEDVRAANTLIDKLAQMSADAKARGEDAPHYDLCNVTVASTNLFCGDNVGVARIDMPQIAGAAVPGSAADSLPRLNPNDPNEVDGSEAFVTYLQGAGMAVTNDRVPAASLKASQRELVGPKVAGMMTAKTYDPGAKPIFISRDGYVLDGHHRWAAVVGRDAENGILGDDMFMNVRIIDSPISELLQLSKEWAARFGIKQKSAGHVRKLFARIRRAGGPGSGNYGHAGRPGEVGGSAPGGGAAGATSNAPGADVRESDISYSTPEMAAQSAAGIAAVERHLPSAIEKANFGETGGDPSEEWSDKSWDDAPQETQDAVFQHFIEQADEEAMGAIDTSYIDDEYERDLRDNVDVLDEATKNTLVSLSDKFIDTDPTLPFEGGIELRRVLDPDSFEIDTEDKDNINPIFDSLRFAGDPDTPLTDEQQALVSTTWDSEHQTAINRAFQDRYEDSDYQDAEAQLRDEYVQEAWNNLGDGEKLQIAHENDLDVGGSSGVESGPPARWLTGTDPDVDMESDDYKRTQAIARQLVVERMDEIAAERGITALTASDIEEQWGNWKNSSSNHGSLALQYAAVEELGGVHRMSQEEVDYIKAEFKYELPRLQAYVRAQWETNQWLMDRAGEDHVDVYRGLMLSGEALKQETSEVVTAPRPASEWGRTSPDTFRRIPEMQLQRSGAQSTTSDRDIANSWSGVGNLPKDPWRAVLRISAPRTSVLSLPVYGVNKHKEHETVLFGSRDRWQWDLWNDKAPSFNKWPIGQASEKLPKAAARAKDKDKGKPKPIVIDLQDVDRGQPHWLINTDATAVHGIEKHRRERAKNRPVKPVPPAGAPTKRSMAARRVVQFRTAAQREYRTALFHGREHVVVPVVAMVGDSIVYPVNGRGAEFVPAHELAVAPAGWNGRHVLPDHPDGGYSSANDPAMLERMSFGTVFNARYANKRLQMDAWLDVGRAAEVDGAPSVLASCLAGEMVEVSVGCYIVLDEQPGMTPKGEPYKYSWRSIVPDHLAIGLSGQEGACSVEMGCGTNRTAGGAGSGNYGHAGRPGEVGGSAPGGGSAAPWTAIETGGPSGAAGILKAVYEADGGFTYHAVTGRQPKKGYVLSVHKDRERIVNAKDLSFEALARYAEDNDDLLVQPGNYLGGWHNPNDGKVYLDVSTVVDSPREAERLGRGANQLAYFDLENMRSVEIGGKQDVPKAAANASPRGPARGRAFARRSRGALRGDDGSQANSRGDRAGQGDPRSARSEKENDMNPRKGLVQRALEALGLSRLVAALERDRAAARAAADDADPGDAGDMADLRSALGDAIGAVEDNFEEVIEIYPDEQRVVYACTHDGEVALYERGYDVDDGGGVTVDDEAAEVEQIMGYQPRAGEEPRAASAAPCSCGKHDNGQSPTTEGDIMTKKELVGRLLARPGADKLFQSAHLESLSEAQLTALDTAMTPPAPVVEPVVAAPAPAPAPETEEEQIAKLPESVRSMVAHYKQRDEAHRVALLAGLKGKTAFADEELSQWKVPQLEALTRSLRLAEPEHDYSGKPIPSAGGDEVPALPDGWDLAGLATARAAARSKPAN